MAKRPTKSDFARVRAIIQREVASGLTIEQATAKAAIEEPEAYKRIVAAPDA